MTIRNYDAWKLRSDRDDVPPDEPRCEQCGDDPCSECGAGPDDPCPLMKGWFRYWIS